MKNEKQDSRELCKDATVSFYRGFFAADSCSKVFIIKWLGCIFERGALSVKGMSVRLRVFLRGQDLAKGGAFFIR